MSDIISRKRVLSVFIALCIILLAVLVYFFVQDNAPKKDDSSVVSVNVSGDKDIEEIYVDLSGAVYNPGVYTLSSGSRLFELLKLGGGVQSSVSAQWVAKSMNLAKVLQDEEKVYIPFEWDTYSNIQSIIDISGQAVDKGARSNLINVNNAGVFELETLDGIGSVYAQRIVANRPYKDRNDLVSKTKLPVSVAERISEKITF